jgi:glycolate oxidase iron-sulfur subunit
VQTSLAEPVRDTPLGREADAILRSCVHCGFCTATCPTYQLLGDELDGPRGRIYLIKQVLEGQPVSATTQLHLDRCLTCRACETTCPSGVRYARLAEIGKEIIERQVTRRLRERLLRRALRFVLPYPARFALLLALGRGLRARLPESIKTKILPKQNANTWPTRAHARKMLVLEGCVQRCAAPNTNAAAARVLDKLGITLLRAPRAGCCGALSLHLNARDEAIGFMKHNIDAWWPRIEAGAEAIVITASGCGAMVKDYGVQLRDDPDYAAKAARISAVTRDLGEIFAREDVSQLGVFPPRRIAFHAPCTLQHGQRLHGVVEGTLQKLGFELTPIPDAHLCCGAAGPYSLLQPELSQQLLRNKLDALHSGKPELIATANIGCELHLASQAGLPVKHWIELVDSDST